MRGLERMDVFRCWFDQVDVHNPEFTAAWVKAHFVSESRVNVGKLCFF